MGNVSLLLSFRGSVRPQHQIMDNITTTISAFCCLGVSKDFNDIEFSVAAYLQKLPKTMKCSIKYLSELPSIFGRGLWILVGCEEKPRV